MSLFKPKSSTDGGTPYWGVCEVAILRFEDKSGTFDWSPIMFDVVVRQKGSEWDRKLTIKGGLEKDNKGNIVGGSVLNKMYHFFDTIGAKVGVNIKGKWETEDGEAIDNIEAHLNNLYTQHANPDGTCDTYPYLAYVYKETPKQAGAKVYSRVHHRVYPNAPGNDAKILSDVKFAKEKGWLKEFDGPLANGIQQVQTDDALDSMPSSLDSL